MSTTRRRSRRPILVCYDDSTGARTAIDAAAARIPDRRVVALDVAPPLQVDGQLDTDENLHAALSTWLGITEIADDIGAAAIVIGSHGLRSLREFSYGSVSEDAAGDAGRPVLVVPPAGIVTTDRPNPTPTRRTT
jgi:hypothetical protein